MTRAAPHNAIVLCMIVKNQEDVLARCLESVRPLLSAWIICDTGSTDRTREIAREVLADRRSAFYRRRQGRLVQEGNAVEIPGPRRGPIKAGPPGPP